MIYNAQDLGVGVGVGVLVALGVGVGVPVVVDAGVFVGGDGSMSGVGVSGGALSGPCGITVGDTELCVGKGVAVAS